jgi:hypothetical protein
MRPRRALWTLLALALLFALAFITPPVTADVPVSTDAASVIVRTGHTENCFPSNTACVGAMEGGPALAAGLDYAHSEDHASRTIREKTKNAAFVQTSFAAGTCAGVLEYENQ